MLRPYRYYLRAARSLPYAALRRVARRKCKQFDKIEPFLSGKCGLEIGGPSPIFCEGRLIPTYNRCKALDNCNFASETIWSAQTSRFRSGRCLGAAYILEACDLNSIASGKYDFVLASHVLEHIANPIRALHEWKRVLRKPGAMLVVVPDKRRNFDHRRDFTTFEHLENDFLAHMREDDLSHVEEVVALHDLELDPGLSRGQFRQRCLENGRFRAMHHHVFCEDVLCRMLEYVNLRVLTVGLERPDHIIVLAQNT